MDNKRISDLFYENQEKENQKKSGTADHSDKSENNVERLPESTRPRQDGPGGA